VTKPTIPTLGRHIQLFFGDYMTEQRGLSHHTVLSYRDALKLLLEFSAQHHKKPVVALDVADLDQDVVLAFLKNMEKTHGVKARTRNARLSALHTFFRYVGEKEPMNLAVCHRVCGIPMKKSQSPVIEYPEHGEVLHILRSIDRSTFLGRRDYLLIHVLFVTGVRAEEAAGLRTSSLQFVRPYQARIVGKGRKERICPIRAQTVKLIRDHLKERRLTPSHDVPVFVARSGEPLTRFGVLRAVQRRVRHAAKTMPALAKKSIGAHSFRHAAAVHLLRSGNDLSVVRSWLGHVSIMTTDHYTEIDNEMKRRALEATDPMPKPRRPSSWKRNPDILDWLQRL